MSRLCSESYDTTFQRVMGMSWINFKMQLEPTDDTYALRVGRSVEEAACLYFAVHAKTVGLSWNTCNSCTHSGDPVEYPSFDLASLPEMEEKIYPRVEMLSTPD